MIAFPLNVNIYHGIYIWFSSDLDEKNKRMELFNMGWVYKPPCLFMPHDFQTNPN